MVIFTQPWYDHSKNSERFLDSLGYPEGTGFYLTTDSVEELFIVTAKHVTSRHDSVPLNAYYWRSRLRDGKTYMLSHVYRHNGVGYYHNDPSVDLTLMRYFGFLDEDPIGKFYTFHLKDIITPAEFDLIPIGSEMFYVGMHPPSRKSRREIIYGRAKGILVEKVTKNGTDKSTNTDFIYDFKLNTIGTPGISGSPVFIRIDDKLKVFGVINGTKIDPTSKDTKKIFIGTAGFRILDIYNDPHIN